MDIKLDIVLIHCCFSLSLNNCQQIFYKGADLLILKNRENDERWWDSYYKILLRAMATPIAEVAHNLAAAESWHISSSRKIIPALINFCIRGNRWQRLEIAGFIFRQVRYDRWTDEGNTNAGESTDACVLLFFALHANNTSQQNCQQQFSRK